MHHSNVIRTRSRRQTVVPARELSWGFILLVVVCAGVVAAGFFFAARQHFTSIDYGIKNSKLREQLENLQAEKRRLQLAREVALSPIAVTKAARAIGMRSSSEVAVPVQVATATKPETNQIIPVKQPERIESKPREAASIVTVAMKATEQDRDLGETRRRIVESPKARKDKTEVAAILKFK